MHRIHGTIICIMDRWISRQCSVGLLVLRSHIPLPRFLLVVYSEVLLPMHMYRCVSLPSFGLFLIKVPILVQDVPHTHTHTHTHEGRSSEIPFLYQVDFVWKKKWEKSRIERKVSFFFFCFLWLIKGSHQRQTSVVVNVAVVVYLHRVY